MCDGGSCQEYRGIMVNGRPDNMTHAGRIIWHRWPFWMTICNEKENYTMLKRIKEEITVKNVKGLNKIAKRAAIGSVNTACSWIFDQPKVPEELKKFRKF